MPEKILVVDDDKDMCLLLSRLLTRKGYEIWSHTSGKEAIAWLKSNKPDMALCDFKLDDISGSSLLTEIKSLYRDVPVVIITGYSDVKNAVEMMKLGAFDYITKPLLPAEILATIKSALQTPAGSNEWPIGTEEQQNSLKTKGQKKESSKVAQRNIGQGREYIMGSSAAFANILHQIDLVAPTNYSVIIYGESGSGKEVIAQQIHKKSKRAARPFIAIDCGALSKELAGSELFGHEKGSFTGALTQKVGSLELANGGTIFLDEIGNLGYDIQVSLLRVVQERKIRRVGGSRDISLDIRIIVASNENLLDAARKGKFREDLYHRFNEFKIDVPPLRERQEDLLTFAQYFLDQTNEELGKTVKGFSREVQDIFRRYPWFGNLRELKNVIKRATLLATGATIDAATLPFEITHYHKLLIEDHEEEHEIIKHNTSTENRLKEANLDAEYEVILAALKQANYNKSKAAKLLNIDRKTLYNKMKQIPAFNLDF